MKGVSNVFARAAAVGGAVVESARVCMICTVTCIGSDASANLSSSLFLCRLALQTASFQAA